MKGTRVLCQEQRPAHHQIWGDSIWHASSGIMRSWASLANHAYWEVCFTALSWTYSYSKLVVRL